MGRGSYTASDWAKLKDSRGISQTASVESLFRNQSMNEKYDPKFITYRESVDSEDSPNATPIIIAFDDTGSMGYLAEELAKSAINKTVTEIYDKKPVSDPHILCAAFGNAPDGAPLQVTQFEADIRIAEQLLDLWIERCGAGYSGDGLVWYFAAKHTKTDCFDKRGQKGFLFTIGDDVLNNHFTSNEINRIFHDSVTTSLTPEEALKLAEEKYHVYHIVTKPWASNCFDKWNSFMPGRVAMLERDGISYLAELIISIMQLTNGMDSAEIIAQWPSEVRPIVSEALAPILSGKKASTPEVKPIPEVKAAAETESAPKDSQKPTSLLQRIKKFFSKA